MKQILPVVVAFILAMVATLGVNQYIAKKQKQYEDEVRPKKVIVFSSNVKAGTRLTQEHLAFDTWPEKMVPENAVPQEDLKEVLNQILNQDVYMGDPLFLSYVGTRRTRQKLSDIVKMEERAITIAVNNISGMESFIMPNDRVDLYAHMKVPYKKEAQVPTPEGGIVTMEVEDTKEVTFLLLQNVTVLATGPTLNSVPGVGYNSITLEATPMEAGLLEFAMRSGELSLALRNNKDFSEDPNIEIIDIESFIDMAKIKELQAARKKRIEVYRAGKSKLIER